MKQALSQGALQALLCTVFVSATTRALVLPSATWVCTGANVTGSIVVDGVRVFCPYGSCSRVTINDRVSMGDLREPDALSTYSVATGACVTSKSLCASQKQRPFYANSQYTCVCTEHGLEADERLGLVCASATPDGHVSPPNSNDVFACSSPSVLRLQPRTCEPAPTQTLRAYAYGVALVRAPDSEDMYVQTQECMQYEAGPECTCRAGYWRVGTACQLCPLGSFCAEESAAPCPGNMTTLYAGAGTLRECVCERGAYWSPEDRQCLFVPAANTTHYVDPCTRVPLGDDRACDVLKPCTPGQVCAQGVRRRCADGEYRLDDTWCLPCPVGAFCRADTIDSCPAHASTAGVRSTSEGHCLCLPGFTTLRAEGAVRCVKAEAQAARAETCEALPPAVDASAHVVWWFAAAPLARTDAAVLEHLALAPVAEAALRLHLRVARAWHVLDLVVPDDLQRDNCLFTKLHVHDSTALLLTLCESGDALRGGSVSFAMRGGGLAVQSDLAWGALLDSGAELRHWSASPVRALLAVLACRGTPVAQVENVTTFSEIAVAQVENVTTFSRINSTRVQAVEFFVEQEECAWTLVFFEDHTFETVALLPRANASTPVPPVRWGRDGVTLAVNATHYVHVDRHRRGDPQAMAAGGVDTERVGAVVANRACSSGSGRQTERFCAADSVIMHGICTPCVYPLVRVSGMCTACPSSQVCGPAPSMRVMCPPSSQRSVLNDSACVCPSGQIVVGSTCQNVSRGWYASGSAPGARPCPPNTTTQHSGAQSKSECTCLPGYYLTATHECQLAPHNAFALGGGDLSQCDVWHTTLGLGASRQEDCVCREGTYGAPGQRCLRCTYPHACPVNTMELGEHTRCRGDLRQNARNSRCVCPEGLYSDQMSPPTCRKCDIGYYCNEVLDLGRQRCPPEMTTRSMQAHTLLQCVCANAGAHKVTAADGTVSCECNRVHYRHEGVCKPCPANSHTTRGVQGVGDCACDDGYHTNASGYGCVLCSPGHWCANGTVFECPRGTYGVMEGQRSERDCVRCSRAVRHMPGQGRAPTAPAHAACLTEFATVAGRGLAGFAGAARARLAATADAQLDLSRAVSQSAYRLASRNVTSAREQWRARTQAWHLALEQHELFHAALFAKLSRNARAWPQLVNETLEKRHDAYAIVGAACFCVLNAYTLQQVESTARNFYCVLPADVDADDPMLVVRPWMLEALGLHTAPDVQFARSAQVAAVRSFVDVLAPSTPLEPFVLFASEAADAALMAPAASAYAHEFLPTLLRQAFLQAQYDVLGVAFRNVPCLEAQVASLGARHGASFGAVESSNGLCARCAPGAEFRAPGLAGCRACNTSLFDAAVLCTGAQALRMCTEAADFACVHAEAAPVRSLCLNQVHDVVEPCDPTDRASPLRGCCRDDCTLVPGFYSFPPCSTICGDGIVAPPVESCEPLTSAPMCNVTCQFSTLL